MITVSYLFLGGGLSSVDFSDGDKEYWLNGKYYHKKAYYKKLKEIDNLPISLKLTHDEEWARERARK